MAEGFSATDYVTSLSLSGARGKRLWLVRVPRHVDVGRLEGVRVKLPRKGREGKVLGRADAEEDSDGAEGDGQDAGLVLRAADAAESQGFRALFTTEENGALAAAAPFAGQVNVSIEPLASDQVGNSGEAPTAALVEPYRGRPQLQGMRVRARLAGAGSVYTRLRHRPGQTTAPVTSGLKEEGNEAPLGATGPVLEPPTTPVASKKKKKRRSAAEELAEGERGKGSISTTKKPKKKSRRRESV